MKTFNAFCILILIGLGILFHQKSLQLQALKNKPEKICKPCLTYHKIMLYNHKYELYIDSFNYGARKHRSRYADSTRKYGSLLNQ